MTVTEAPAEEAGKYEQLRWLTDVYTQVQRLRIANFNRVFAAKEGLDTNEPDPFVAGLVGKLEGLEGDVFREMKQIVKLHPAWPWLEQVRGMGPTLSTKILGLIGDISTFDTVSKLWAFAGYGLRVNEDGVPERQRPVKGQKLDYNRRLKTAVYLAGDSFIKSRSPYRDLYDAAKRRYRVNKQVRPMNAILGLDEIGLPDRATPDGKKEWDAFIKRANKEAGAEKDGAVWSDGHVDNAARRYMAKIFLSHLWQIWREAEGLPVRPPYALEYLDHSTYHDPYAFVGK